MSFIKNNSEGIKFQLVRKQGSNLNSKSTTFSAVAFSLQYFGNFDFQK